MPQAFIRRLSNLYWRAIHLGGHFSQVLAPLPSRPLPLQKVSKSIVTSEIDDEPAFHVYCFQELRFQGSGNSGPKDCFLNSGYSGGVN